MLGLIIPILLTIHVYRNAKETGRNAVLWAVINLAVIFGVQIFMGLSFGIAFGLGTEFFGWEENLVEKWTIGINLATLVVSLLCSYFFVVRAVTRIPEEQFSTPPPPPPQFG
ncbi:MAG: hypothetical protein M3209_03555 [Acidobacteriota bacterium]|nr:hypothetical protein [Acidobacteriota bacterium]